MRIDIPAFIASLRYMIEGWLGIFLVMAVIIAVIYGLNALTNRDGQEPHS